MSEGNSGEIDFGSSQGEVRVSECSSYRESTVICLVLVVQSYDLYLNIFQRRLSLKDDQQADLSLATSFSSLSVLSGGGRKSKTPFTGARTNFGTDEFVTYATLPHRTAVLIAIQKFARFRGSRVNERRIVQMFCSFKNLSGLV